MAGINGRSCRLGQIALNVVRGWQLHPVLLFVIMVICTSRVFGDDSATTNDTLHVVSAGSDFEITQICQSPSGQAICAGSDDGRVTVWRLKGNEACQIATTKVSNKPICRLAFTHDEKALCVMPLTTPGIFIWSLPINAKAKTEAPIRVGILEYWRMCISADDRYLAAVHTLRGCIYVWDLKKSDQPPREFKVKGEPCGIFCTHDNWVFVEACDPNEKSDPTQHDYENVWQGFDMSGSESRSRCIAKSKLGQGHSSYEEIVDFEKKTITIWYPSSDEDGTLTTGLVKHDLRDGKVLTEERVPRRLNLKGELDLGEGRLEINVDLDRKVVLSQRGGTLHRVLGELPRDPVHPASRFWLEETKGTLVIWTNQGKEFYWHRFDFPEKNLAATSWHSFRTKADWNSR